MRKGLCFALVWVVLVCALTGCSSGPAQVRYECFELSISLPQTFVDLSGEDFSQYDVLFSDGTVTLAGIREDKSLLPKDLSLEDFGQLVIHAHELDCQLQQNDGLTYFNYEAGAPAFTYTVGVWETEDAFWSVQTYCKSEDYAAVRKDMWQLLQSVCF